MAIHYPENKSQDVLLAYSPNSSIYDLIRSPNCPDTAFLGITVRNALAAPIRAREIHRKQPVNPPPTLENPNLDAIFEEQFKIKFEDLATVQSPKKVRAEQAFYLMFPVDNEAAQEEFQVVVEFLKYDGRDLAIYSNRDPQDWRKFIGTTQSGVVLVCSEHQDLNPETSSLMRTAVPRNFYGLPHAP